MARVGGCAVLALALAGCTQTVPVAAGPSATDPACAQLLVALPDRIGEGTRQETTSQSTAAYTVGGQVSLTLRCGVAEPGPTTDPCTTVGQVDWVVAGDDTIVSYLSYGRRPAVEVSVPTEGQDGVDTALNAVSGTMSGWPVTASCL